QPAGISTSLLPPSTLGWVRNGNRAWCPRRRFRASRVFARMSWRTARSAKGRFKTSKYTGSCATNHLIFKDVLFVNRSNRFPGDTVGTRFGSIVGMVTLFHIFGGVSYQNG